MSMQHPIEDDDDEQLGERDDPIDSDMDESDDPAEVPCPYCRRPISEEAEMCPHCGSLVVIENGPRRYSWWYLIALVLILLTIATIWRMY